MNCNNYFDMTDQGDSFESWQGLRGPAGPQGPAGTPGAPGTSVELRGPVETTVDLPETASSSELWLVGSAAPYHGWFYNGSSWEDAGEIAVGPTGPQGPQGQDGTDGSDGVTFTPTVSSAGVISWTNDGGLPNPDPVNIKGPQGETGATGATGPAGQDGTDGSNGVTFTPTVSSAGVISWTNDGGLPNPESVNIKGPQGQTGQTGATGPAGQDGTDGSDGVTFTPTVSSAGVISWTNDGGLPNPDSVNIKGPAGDAAVTKITIALSTSWTGSGPYTQTVTVSGGTANSKVSLQLDDAQIAQLIADGVKALRIDNNNGTFTAHAVGAAPSTALTLQATRVEVTT